MAVIEKIGARTVGVTRAAIAHRLHIEALLGTPVRVVAHARQAKRAPAPITAIAGWGNKPSGEIARVLAQQLNLPRLLLEDGFLRSAGDATDPQAISLVVDDIGIYYDAHSPSRLECLISEKLDASADARTHAVMDTWRTARLSKYNHVRDATRPLDDYVLVVDQTYGDLAIEGAMATPADFERMLEAALDEHSGATVLLKVHPDVVAGRKRGHFGHSVQLSPGAAARVHVVADHCHAPDLLEHARVVYTVSSQLGLEALIWQRPVRVFGMPFYAGWGLTADAMRPPARRGRASLAQLVHAALIAYTRYVDPETGQRCEVERAIEHLALQRRMRNRFPETIHAVGFSRWKRPIARAFFSGSTLRFVRRPRQLPAGVQAVALWGARPLPAGLQPETVIRVEDGFVRSVGLGARLVPPRSWLLDSAGIHYDAHAPSALEMLLAQAAFSPALLERARRLRHTLTAARITKYNLAGPSWTRPAHAHRVVLVTGQVEDDASLAYGSPLVRTNAALLEAVRALEPDAFVVYKPHPDVAAGLRRGGAARGQLAAHADAVLTGEESIVELIDAADAVHVMTSLTGFEALLHGKPVTTHGVPFYAGWGLTADRCACTRRVRRLLLDELVAAALILYPTYVSAATGRFTTPERVLEELISIRTQASALSQRAGAPLLVLRVLRALRALGDVTTRLVRRV
jgi:capsular polysaccharide export protein